MAAWGLSFLFDVVEDTAEFGPEGGAAESENFGGSGLHIPCKAHGLEDYESVKFLDDCAIRVSGGIAEGLFGELSQFLPFIDAGSMGGACWEGFLMEVIAGFERDEFGQECWAGGQDECFPKDALEFPNISGPAMILEFFEGFGRDGLDAGAELLIEAEHQVVREFGDIFDAFAEGRDLDSDIPQAVVEVVSEAAICDGGIKSGSGRREDSDINRQDFRSAETLELTILEEPEEADLCGGCEFADVIEEDGAGVGLFDFAESTMFGAGECSFFMSEEFAFEE
ncbi:MAG: hypothetical protein RL215_1819 [Planctomycetota bacterium]